MWKVGLTMEGLHAICIHICLLKQDGEHTGSCLGRVLTFNGDYMFFIVYFVNDYFDGDVSDRFLSCKKHFNLVL